LGNAELARLKLPDDSPALCHLVDVETAAERAGELTDQLLAYTGKGKFVREEIDLSDLVLGVAGLLSVSISKGVHLDYSLAEKLPPIRGGSGQLRQIVMNLVTNAADSIGERAGQIRLETGIGLAPEAPYSGATVSFGEPSRSSVYLRVTDEGGGMDEDTLSRIFDPFFTTKFAGRGLGLAAVLGIIKSHDGCLRVDSNIGSGSSFTVSFPVAEGAGDAAISRDGTPVRVEPSLPILVVDDEPHVRAVLERMISAHGFEVMTASDGVEAIELYRSQLESIGLVILDLTMPGLNGEQTWAHLRAFDPDVRVLFSSGYSEENAEFRFREPDARTAFIHKPYRREQLLEMINGLLAD
ncbi:MAG: response regulator, partial [Myxococcota bacterium]